MKRFVTLIVGVFFLTTCAAGLPAPGGPGQPIPGKASSPAAGVQEPPTQIGQDVDHTRHFRVFTGEGQPSSLEEIVTAMNQAEAVLVGEIHTDPVGHWIEAELFKEALTLVAGDEGSAPPRPLALSLEMFERDVQGIVDEYLMDLITESQFTASARPWEFYASDYRPMVEMAKEAGVPVIAANAPRRYVNRVSRLGRDALMDLSPEAKKSLPPLPYPQPSAAYREEWNALMSNMTMEQACPPPAKEEGDSLPGMGHPPGMVSPERPDSPPREPPAGMPPSGPPSHGGSFLENGLQAQTLWDASMARSITAFLEENPGGLVVHMVGGFHVQNFTGTPEKVQDYRPGTRTLVVAMELAEDFDSFDPEEHAGLGDFVILTDKSLDLNIPRNCAGEG